MSDTSKNITPFSGAKYSVWRSRVRALIDETILVENALQIISQPNRPNEISEQEWLKRNKIAKGIIIRNLSDSLVGLATNPIDISAYEIFKKLDDLYMRKSLQTELSMEMKLLTLKFDESKPLQDHLNLFDEMVQDLEAASGKKLDETNKIARLLSTLPKSYSPLVIAIQTIPDENLNLSLIKIRLLEHEITVNKDKIETKTLMASSKKSNNNASESENSNRRNKYNLHNKNWNRSKNINKNRYINKNKNNRNKFFKKCEHCGRNNHIKKDCYYFKRIRSQNDLNQQPQQQQQQSNATYTENISENMQEQHFVFMMKNNNNNEQLNKVLYTLSNNAKIQFILDSGATDHLINDVDIFNTVEDLVNPIIIKTAKINQTISATKRGTINIKTENGFSGTLKDVLYTNELPFNLLSIKKMQESGLDIIFSADGKVIFKKNGQVIMKTLPNKNLSMVTFIIDNKKCNLINTGKVIDNYQLWHERLGHISKLKFLELKEKNLITDAHVLKSINPTTELCEACITSKQVRLPFNKKKDRSQVLRPLYAIHSDVCGPITPNTIDDKKYFVTFIDEFTHYTVVYLIKLKSEVFKCFKDYVNKSESVFNLKIAFLYCDNGNEYLSSEFKEFCSEKGIQYHLTVPYTPQQNSLAERMNRTLVEKARAMIHGAQLSKEFWGEAILTATYILNITPTKALNINKTPFELWHNKKPCINRLRKFGSTVYMLIKTKIDKFDKKSIKGILVGYMDNGYKVFNTQTNKCIVTRDVIFDEVNFKTSRPVNELNGNEKTDKTNLEISNENSLGQNPENIMDNNEENSSIGQETLIENSPKRQKKTEISNEPDINREKENYLRSSARLKNKPIISYKEDDISYHICAQSLIDEIPNHYHEIQSSPNKIEWEKAVKEELDSLYKNKTWNLVPCPQNKNVIDCRWVFSIKKKGENNLPKYKARLVAKGFSQQYMQDYFDTFAPVARLTTLRIMLAISNQYDLLIHQMDVKTAFLNGTLKEEIYMKVPEGIKKRNNYVCKLNKAIYGLKQAARCWYQHFDQVLKRYGFINSSVDRCLYLLERDNIKENVYLLLYVDDILVFTFNPEKMFKVKQYLKHQFSMVDMLEIKTFLGININRTKDTITLDQSDYLEKVLSKFNMSDCNTISNPLPIKLNYENLNSEKHYDAPCRELIGCLMYVMLCTRPDLCISLNLLSRYQTKNNIELWQLLKRVLRYIKGTLNHKLVYKKNNFENILKGYADADWANNELDRKSTTGYIFKLFDSCTICWNSKRQNSVATSSTEAEYMALFEGVKEVCWLKSFLESINIKVYNPIPIYEDNKSCIAIANNPTDHRRSKHIDIKYHFTREKVEQKLIIIKFISTEQQLADLFTKPLATPKFLQLREEMGIKEG